MAEHHIRAVAELEKLCFSEPWSEESLKLLCESDYPSAVLELSGSAVGYIGSQKVLDELQITNVAIHPDHRGIGCGSDLLEAFIAMAEKLDISTISLEVRESNLAALALYKKFGFLPMGTRRGFYKNPREDAIVMVKELKDQDQTRKTEC